MQALQFDKEDPVIFATWMLSLVTLQARKLSIEKTGMALYPFFVEGMLSAKNANTVIIDGNELGFSYKSEYQYVFSGMELRDWGVALMPTDLKPLYQNISISHPIFFDLLYATFPDYDKGYSQNQKQNWLESDLYHAFKSSDQYVWFYNQKINWWQSDNDSIASIIRKVEARLGREFNKKGKLSGYAALEDFLEPANKSQTFFTYRFNSNKKSLVVNFLSQEIVDFYIFENSRLLEHISNPVIDFNFNLKSHPLSGNLILVAKNNKNKYSFAYVN